MKNSARPLFILLTLAALIIISVSALLFGSFTGDDGSEKLVVVSYSSFLNEWGPGPEIEKMFQERTGRGIHWVDAGDAGLIVERLRFQSGQLRADFVIGLDQWTLEDASRLSQWLPIDTQDVTWHSRLPEAALHASFVPFDWGPLAFVYREGEVEPPASLDELLAPEYHRALALQDPRTSSPGLQFVYWILASKGIDGGYRFLRELSPSVQSISNSWSTAYGLFKSGRAKLTFSYITSPLYHEIEENDSSYKSAIFQSGHPYQVEYFGIPESASRVELAQEFAKLLLSPEAQKAIMLKNYMLPVVEGVEEGTAFADLPDAPLLPLEEAQNRLPSRQNILRRWKELGL